MAFYKVPSNLKTSILGFVKHLLPKQTTNDIDLLLSPCCIPTIAVADDFGCVNVSDTTFDDVTVSTAYKSKTALLVFTFTLPDGTVNTTSKLVTLDTNGSWNGSVTLYDFVHDGTVDIKVTLILGGSQVAITSKTITVTGVTNCD